MASTVEFERAPKVCLYAEKRRPSAWIRCFVPYGYLHRLGLIELIPRHRVLDADVVVIKNAAEESAIEYIRWLKHRGIGVVVDFDDDVWLREPKNWRPGNYSTMSYENVLDGILREASVVTYSSREILNRRWWARGKREYGPSFVIPNALDSEHWDTHKFESTPIPKNGKLVFGFGGGVEHFSDFDAHREMLIKFAKQHRDTVEWRFAGYVPRWLALEGVDVYHAPPVPPWQYPSLLWSLNLDLGLIPLDSTEFNDAKSDLKRMEYQALGIPFLGDANGPYSDLPRYNWLCRHYLLEAAAGRLPPAPARPIRTMEMVADDYMRVIAAALEESTKHEKRIPSRKSHSLLIGVPVHGQQLKAAECLRGVLEGDMNHRRVCVVDDGNTEPLSGDSWDSPGVVILRNQEAKGYVESANKVARMLNPGEDLLIVNSDAYPTGADVAKLREIMENHPEVGVLIPCSDNAGFATLPDGPVESGPEVIYTPTVPGFCMYVRNDVIQDRGGLFDEVFSPGYGEEDDLCQWAIRHGWQVAVTPRVCVRHDGRSSFGNSLQTESLRASYREILESRYPGFGAQVDTLLSWNELFAIRESQISGQKTGIRVLQIISQHDPLAFSGGVGVAAQALTKHLRGKAHVFTASRSRNGGKLLLHYNDAVLAKFDYLPGSVSWMMPIYEDSAWGSWRRLLAQANPDVIHIQDLSGHPIGLWQLFEELGIPVVVSIRDHSVLSPAPHAELDADTYAAKFIPKRDKRVAYLDEREAQMRGLLEYASCIAAPSRFAASIPASLTDKAVSIVPNGVFPEIEYRERKAPMKNIGYLGAYHTKKGVHTLLKAWGNGISDCTLHLHGIKADVPIPESTTIVEHGPYTQGQLPQILNGLDVVVVPSEVPETFSRTAHEAAAAGCGIITTGEGALDSISHAVLYRKGAVDELRCAIEIVAEDGVSYPKDRRIIRHDEEAQMWLTVYRKVLGIL